jgi:alkylation response protein AidB-like acyl-CoA dehydrogenase
MADGDRIWLDGVPGERARGTELGGFDLPGGRVVVLRLFPGTVGAADEDERAAWALGLVWLRLGLSEALRETCLRRLRTRRTGDSLLVRQQLVKGALADAVVDHLEIRALLTGAGELTYAALAELHTRITMTDRAQLRLLGASGYLLGSPGEVAHVSELVADAYRTGSGHEPA